MADYFLGEIRLFAFSFAPSTWHFCDGAQLLIAQNQALYALLGIQFGGDGAKNFNLPDLRGRTPVHYYEVPDATRITTGKQGSAAGADSITLSPSQAPAHTHTLSGTSSAATSTYAAYPPQANMPATSVQTGSNPSPLLLYIPPAQAAPTVNLSPSSVTALSAAVPHENRQPFLAANYCIAISGLYPMRP